MKFTKELLEKAKTAKSVEELLEMAKAENISLISEKYHLQSPVYVGDTMGDYQACRKAGVPFIFASYGFGDVPTPDAVIKSPLDLVSLCLSDPSVL